MGERVDKSLSGRELYRFGSMAIIRGYVTLAQIQHALAVQVDDDINRRRHRPLGNILREKGWMTEEQERSILKEMSEEARGEPK